jgi:predicted amidophosphoribosyltransferase
MNIIDDKNISWAGGWFMDKHTLKSVRTPEGFKNDRSEIGELLYQYKYKNNRDIYPILADKMFDFIKSENKLKHLSTVTWVPSSKPRVNPILEPIAIRLAERIGCNYEELITRKKDRDYVKHKNKDEIEKILENAFELDLDACKQYNGKKVLLIDDLCRTRMTFKKIAELVRENTSICLYGLAITQTRTLPNA